jgi:hypothetical protein
MLAFGAAFIALALAMSLALGLPTSARALTGAPATTQVPSGTATVPSCCGTTTTVAPPTAAPAAPVSAVPNTRPRSAGSSISTGAIAIAALAALVALACVAWGIARRRAFEPKWMLFLRHSMAEAGFHASATWAEFTDWVRLGR